MRRRPPNRPRRPAGLTDVDFSAFVEQIPPATYIMTPGEADQPCLYISPQVEPMLGFPPEAWTSGAVAWPSRMHPEDRANVLRSYEEHNRTLEPWDEEYRLVAQDGSVVWVRDQATLVLAEDGTPMFWQGLMSDITHAKMAEEVLRESEERYRALVEQVPAVVYLLSNDRKPAILYVAPQVQSLVGYSPDELSSDPMLWTRTIIHEEDRELVAEEWTRALEQEDTYDTEYRVVARDGHQLWVRDHHIPIRDETGAVIYRQGVMYEVTDRKLWEESLRESEERYRALVEQVPAVVYIDSNDPLPRSLYVSPQVQPLFGFRPADLMADRHLWLSRIHPDDRETFLERWARVVETGESFEAEYRVIATDGRLAWVQDRTVLMHDEHGQPLAWQGVIHDITVEKEAERRTQESAAKYRALVENIPAIIYEVAPDGDGSTLYVSPQVEHVLGYAREEWLEQPDIWMELLHHDDREPTLAAYDLHNETGEPWSREYRLIASDGRAVWFRDEATLARDVSGRVLAWQGVRLDITGQKLAEEALQSAHDDLEERVRDRTQDLEEANELMMLEVLERRRAESAVREAEERFRLLVERIPAVVYTWQIPSNPNDPQYYTSPQIERLTGFTAEEWDSTPDFWMDRIHPHDRKRMFEASMRSESTGEPFSLEYRILAKDGSVVWVLDEATIVRRNREGRPALFQGVMIDITDRKESLERLERAEARALMMAEHLPAITYLWDPDAPPGVKPLSYVSPEIERILGYAPEDWLEDPNAWLGCLHPDDRERATLPSWTDMPGGQWSVEYRLIARDGRVMWFRDSGRVLPGEGDQRAVLNGIMIDITVEKEREERLRTTEEHYRTLVEQIPAITYIEAIDAGDPAKSHLIFVSPQAEELFGFTPEELIAEPDHMSRMVHPDDLEGYRAAESAANDGSPFRAEYRVLTRDGNEVWVESQSVVVRDEEGTARFWHGLALDITARKRAEEELRAIETKFRELVESDRLNTEA